MYKLLIIITLHLFPNGMVTKTTEEIYLTPKQDCLAEADGIIEYFERTNKDENIKLLSVACSTKQEM